MQPQDLVGSPWEAAYARVAPRPENWPALIGKAKQLLGEHTYDWTAEVRGIEIPTQIVVGDADSISAAASHHHHLP
ncbi:MAG TPA: hypothetical protein VHS99_02405 [Chloroflexota bacterium]|jgi:pimeloyl-ACP methyl ester carboxylesterase|nr:hypothetical protein [Chloroflexota bacterium]